MSVINNALKDLEARHANVGQDGLTANVRVALRPARIDATWMVGVLVMLATAGSAAWLFLRTGSPAEVAAAPAAPPKPAVVAAAPAAAPAPAAVPVALAPAVTPTPVPVAAQVAQPPVAVPASAPVAHALAASAPVVKPAEKKPPPPTMLASMAVKPIAEPGLLKVPTPAPAASSAEAVPANISAPQLEKSIAPGQLSQSLYAQAVVLVQQGNGIEARPMLRRAIQADPANAGARQLLANLLVESNNLAEAATLLREGTRIAPDRSGLWMSLARVELEQGDAAAAMADLESGLPSAGTNAEYHGFYAALLQRAQRHDDAVAHYLQALRGDPAMPTWLVGIGISLQALGRPAEALEAFQRARDGGRLNASLQDFVSNRIDQLRR